MMSTMSSSNFTSAAAAMMTTTSTSALGATTTTHTNGEANIITKLRNNVNVISVTMEKTTSQQQYQQQQQQQQRVLSNNSNTSNNMSGPVAADGSTMTANMTGASVNDPMTNSAATISATGAANLQASRVNYARRGRFYGVLFDADHLATFAVGKQGLMRAEDGIRKLRQMEKNQGIWAMECELMIDGKSVVVFDKKTGNELETFAIELVCDPTSVVSDDKKDAAYNNIILFTVLEDVHDKKSSPSPPTEMHIFQCAADVNSADVVDEIYKVKETKMNEPHGQQQQQQQQLHSYTITSVEQPSRRSSYSKPSYYPPTAASGPTGPYQHAPQVYNSNDAGYRRLIIPTQHASSDYNNNNNNNNNSNASSSHLPSSVLRNRAAVLAATSSVDSAGPVVSQQQHTNNYHPPAPHMMTSKSQMVHFEQPYVPPHMLPSTSTAALPPQAPLSAPHNPPHNHHHHQPHNSSHQPVAAVAAPLSSAVNQLSASRIDLEVQVLNHCFDDIERFVSRVLADVEAVHELERRQLKCKHKSLKSKKMKQLSDEIAAMRAQMPQAQSFVDVFQKFKLSFNLLARLKSHIHDPSAPELVHYLFEPLGLVMNAISKEYAWLLDMSAAATEVAHEQATTNAVAAAPSSSSSSSTTTSANLKGLPKGVWLPMLNRDAKELLFNCLNSKEQELWFTLSDAWMVSREDAKLQPHLYANNIDLNQLYTPIFYDGWAPNMSTLLGIDPYSVSYPSSSTSSALPPSAAALMNPPVPMSNDFSRLAYSAAAQVHQNGALKYAGPRHAGGYTAVDSGSMPHPSSLANGSHNNNNNNNYTNNNTKRINFVDDSTLSNNTSRPGGNVSRANRTGNQNESTASAGLNYSKPLPQINIRNYDEMKKWAIDLAYRGAKVYEVMHDRQGNNEKELTIKSGELLEVLDDKRNWWKLRNFYGNIGHAPVTILRPFDPASAGI